MKIHISGSLAYDRIMDFPGRFKEHILPEKVHMINVSFGINVLKENFGGTAGNIAYSLRLLGSNPTIVASVGRDFKPYMEWLKKNKLDTSGIKIINSELTAGAYIITDRSNNQITAFHFGAMSHSVGRLVTPADNSLVIISPGNADDMLKTVTICKKKRIPYIFDPGQQIPAIKTNNLRYLLQGSEMFIVNDYEYALVCKRLGIGHSKLMKMTNTAIVTKGAKGSETTTQNSRFLTKAVTPRKIVDPTGAGDAFRSGLIHGIINSYPLKKAVQLATLVATYPIEHHGTQEHRFTKKEINSRFLRNFKTNL